MLSDDRLAFGTHSGSIIIYNLITNKEDFTITNAGKIINCLKCCSNNIILLSLNKIVSVYQIIEKNNTLLFFCNPFDIEPLFASEMSNNRLVIATSTSFFI